MQQDNIVDEAEVDNLRQMFRSEWQGSYSQFAHLNNLNVKNFARWVNGKRNDQLAARTVERWLSERITIIKSITKINLDSFLLILRDVVVPNNINYLIFADGDQGLVRNSNFTWFLDNKLSTNFILFFTTNDSQNFPKTLSNAYI